MIPQGADALDRNRLLRITKAATSLFLMMVMVSIPLTAEKKSSVVYTLPAMIRQAMTNNPLITVQDIRIKNAVLQLDTIKHKAILPALNFNVQFGVTPESDQDLINGLGPFTRFELQALQPIYTFGKVGYAKELAGYGIDAARIKAKLSKQKITFQSCRMFWSLRAANKGMEIARKLRKDYRKLLKDVIRDSKKKDSDITAVDMLKVKTSSFTIEQQYHSALEAVRKVSATIRIFLQLKDKKTLSASSVIFPTFDYKKFSPLRALAAAENTRPELLALHLTEMASRAQYNLARSMRYPDFFIAGGAKFRWAPNRASDDDYNDKGVGAFLGLRWKLNFWQSNDGVKKARLKMQSMKEKGKLLRAKVEMEVRTAHSKLVKEYNLLQEVKKSLKKLKDMVPSCRG